MNDHEELDEETIARREEKEKKFSAKLNDFMAEMGEEMLEDEDREKIEGQLKGIFAKRNLAFNTSNLESFVEGATMSLSAIVSDKSPEMPMMLIMICKGIIKKRKTESKKVAEDSMKSNGL